MFRRRACRHTSTRASPITPRRRDTRIGDLRLGIPSRSTVMYARTMTRSHSYIFECIRVEVATIGRSPQPMEP